jgi:hypothetical protein
MFSTIPSCISILTAQKSGPFLSSVSHQWALIRGQAKHLKLPSEIKFCGIPHVKLFIHSLSVSKSGKSAM